MVEYHESIDHDNKVSVAIKDPMKNKIEYTVKVVRPMTALYGVTVSKGSVPKALSGSYTTIQGAIDDVTRYINRLTKSSTLKRDENWKRRNDAKSNSDTNDLIQ